MVNGICEMNVQVVTSMPSKKLPKRFFSCGSQPPEEVEPSGDVAARPSIDGVRSGQILWLRGLTRLQTQVRVEGTLLFRPVILHVCIFVVDVLMKPYRKRGCLLSDVFIFLRIAESLV